MQPTMPSLPPPPDLPTKEFGCLSWVKVLAILGVVVVIGLLALAALTNQFWSGLDGGSASPSDVKALRPECGIPEDAFESPEEATGSGFQEHTYTYRYANKSADWVDDNILGRFEDPESVADREAYVADEYGMGPERSIPNVILDSPEVVTTDGALVYFSPVADSEMGTTWFDVYRGLDGTYAVVVSCNNTAGINYSAKTAAVSTTVP